MDIFKNIKDFFVPPEEGDEQYEEMSRSRQYSGSDILLKETAIMREAEATEQNALTVMKKKEATRL